VPLSGVTVTDDNGTPGNTADDFVLTTFTGDTDGDGRLDVNETTTVSTSTRGRIETGEIFSSRPLGSPGPRGQYTNFATATGTPPGRGPPVTTPPTPDNHFVANPGHRHHQADQRHQQRLGPRAGRPAGSTVTFTYSVTKHRQRAALGRHVTDDNGTPGNTADDLT
jgi:hypothetical protein